jgi:hypothetical protein
VPRHPVVSPGASIACTRPEPLVRILARRGLAEARVEGLARSWPDHHNVSSRPGSLVTPTS